MNRSQHRAGSSFSPPGGRRFAWFGALSAAVLCASGSPARPLETLEYHARTWTTDNGLPHNSTSGVLQDSVGFMWFATTGGLARFDGREFREIRPPAEHRSSGFNIRAFAEEKPGVLVVAPTGGTLLRWLANHWEVHPMNEVLAPLRDAPLSLIVDAGGRIWIATNGNRLLRWSPDGSAQTYEANTLITTSSRRAAFAADDEGGAWINADRLWYAAPRAEPTPVELESDEPRLVGAGKDGIVWMLTADRLRRLRHGRVIDTQPIQLPTEFMGLHHLFEDATGTVWIASTRAGLLRVENGTVRRVSTLGSALYVTEDRERNVWVATDGSGVAQLRQKPYRLINTAGGLRHDVVSSLAEDSTGRVWLANRGGGLPTVEADGRIRPSALAGTRSFANVVQVDSQDRIWFGGGRNGLLWWSRDAEAPVQLPRPMAALHVLFRAANGDMWFAADSDGAGYYRNGELQMLSGSTALPQIRAIAQDREGAIWLGSRSGDLLRWKDGRLEPVGVEQGFRRAPVHAIHVDDEGVMWIGTPDGLVVRDGATFRVLTEAHGLVDSIIHGVVDDPIGNLWLASRRGLFHVRKADLLAAARDGTRRVECYRLGPNEGLVGLTLTANYHPAVMRARDGTLWFATAQGGVVVDPTRMPRDLPAPPLLVDEVRVDGTPAPHAGGLRIRSAVHRVEFRLVALSYTAPESVILRHRLDGVDQSWVDTPADRTATYTNLAPGDYRLRVMVRNSTGRWSRGDAMLAFTVVPAWWETTAVRLAAAAILVVIVAATARTVAQRRLQQRLRRLEQQHALEKERNRIARDLHDELGAGLTEVGLLADRLVEFAPREVAPQLSGLAWRTRRLATDLSGIVWTMNASHSSLYQLAVFLRRYAERFFRNTGTRCIVNGIEQIPELVVSPELQHQILATTKEALNNILKHARASEAVLELRHEHGVFEVQLRDNGLGFEPSADAGGDGNGLRNMRARMNETGGSFELVSMPGKGTTVTFRVPCAGTEPP